VVNDLDLGQRASYFAGIGTPGRFDRGLRKTLNKWGGGAFGWGLDGKVKEAYQYVAMMYQPGDEIYLFGFSRGAYTARSVAGMIRKCGIVKDLSSDGINAAFKLYRKTGARNAPDTDHIMAERRALSPHFATSQKDMDARAAPADLVKIAYMGVFDTVGARGMPPSILGPVATIWNRQYAFHDMVLTRLVQSARHAMALDERRPTFKPAPWDNLDDAHGKPGLNGSDTSDGRLYQQKWFVGTHSIVGGSDADAQALCTCPMAWVLAGAPDLLRKEGEDFPKVAADPNIDAAGIDHRWNMFKRWRRGPTQKWEIDKSVHTRLQARPDYRPKSLKRFLP
jgi:uncharacterized protein (DUF2235 family)